jgi:hypothetical protein
MRRAPRFGVFSLIAAFVLLAAFVPLFALLPGVATITKGESSQRLTGTLRAAAQQTAAQLNDHLADLWREHATLVQIAMNGGVNQNFNVRLDTAKMLNRRLAWIGVASPEGRVILASERVLLGADVSARPWFRAGLQAPFAGDVREALRLSAHLPAATDGEPVRLVDFSSPLRGSDGTTHGVLVSTVAWSWVRDLIRTAAMPDGAQALLITRNGTVLAGPAGMEGTRLATGAGLSARQGASASSVETWADGVSYLTVAVPIVGAEGAPSFGWSVVIRQNHAAVVNTAHLLGVTLGLPLMLGSVIVLVTGVLVAVTVARPLRRLALASTALADGRLEKPVGESRTSWEMAAIADALARLDHRVPTNFVPIREVA